MITDNADAYPEHKCAYCSECGTQTIMNCPNCNSEIRGEYFVEGIYGGAEGSVPAYCHQCGNPYPWTEAKLQAANDLADELDELSQEDRELLKGTFADLMKESPQTEVAAIRFKKVLAKVGRETAKTVRDLVVDIASETAKKVIMEGLK